MASKLKRWLQTGLLAAGLIVSSYTTKADELSTRENTKKNTYFSQNVGVPRSLQLRVNYNIKKAEKTDIDNSYSAPKFEELSSKFSQPKKAKRENKYETINRAKKAASQKIAEKITKEVYKERDLDKKARESAVSAEPVNLEKIEETNQYETKKPDRVTSLGRFPFKESWLKSSRKEINGLKKRFGDEARRAISSCIN